MANPYNTDSSAKTKHSQQTEKYMESTKEKTLANKTIVNSTSRVKKLENEVCISWKVFFFYKRIQVELQDAI